MEEGSKAFRKVKKNLHELFRVLIRKIEPPQWPDKPAEKILEDAGCHPRLIETTMGRMMCFRIEWQKFKRVLWEECFGRHSANGK